MTKVFGMYDIIAICKKMATMLYVQFVKKVFTLSLRLLYVVVVNIAQLLVVVRLLCTQCLRLEVTVGDKKQKRTWLDYISNKILKRKITPDGKEISLVTLEYMIGSRNIMVNPSTVKYAAWTTLRECIIGQILPIYTKGIL